MRLITSVSIRALNYNDPKEEVIIQPGEYILSLVPNPLPKPEHLEPKFWNSHWYVTNKGIGFSSGAWEHNYIHHSTTGVKLIK